MNRINELEMGRTPLITPTVQKLIDSSDELSDAPAKVYDDILHHERPKRTRSGSQSSVVPLSSHDQNSLRTRQQVGAKHLPAVFESEFRLNFEMSIS